MKTTQKQSLENPLRFSQLMYRSVIFCAIILILFLLFGKINSKITDNYYFSHIEITKTYIYNSLIIFIIWFLYLIFVTKDNTLTRMWNVLKLRGTFSDPKEVSIRWYVLFFLAVFSMFTSFNIVVHLNSINNQVIYEGTADVHLIERKNNYDKRFEKIKVTYNNQQIELYGHKKDVDNVVGKKISVSIYQGVFYEYMLVKK